MPGQRHSYPKSFKAQVVDECTQPSASVAGTALSHGLNANLVHKWIRCQQAQLPADARWLRHLAGRSEAQSKALRLVGQSAGTAAGTQSRAVAGPDGRPALAASWA